MKKGLRERDRERNKRRQGQKETQIESQRGVGRLRQTETGTERHSESQRVGHETKLKTDNFSSTFR